jgi:surface protein
MGYVIIELAEVSSCAYFDVVPAECQSSYTFIPKETEGLHKWIIKGDSTTYSDTTLTYSFVEGSHTIYHVFSSDICSVDTFEYKLSVNPKPSLDYLVVQNETCHQKNGGFDIKIVGGASPYIIKYNNKEVLVNSNVFSFGSLGAGNYLLNITDHNNCSVDTQFTIIDTAVGLCDFVTVWDLSKKGFFLNDNISFFRDVAKGGTSYTWEEISPGSAKGSGRIKAGEGPFLISGLPKNAVIRLTISHENLNKFYMNKNENRQRLVEVEQWGIANWKSMENAFNGCNNLDVTATDIPDLTDVSSMSKMFLGCISLKGLPNFNNWNTESVRNFSQMFMNAGSFNQDISNWDTENVIDMSSMFRNATSFNQNLNDWITDNVENMASMFSDANSFNHSIGNWLLNPSLNMTGMLDNSGMDCNVYSRVLKDWSSNPATPNDRILGANGMEYGTFAQIGRGNLLETNGWKISGDIALTETCFSCKTHNITKYTTVCDSLDLSKTIDTLITVEGCDSIITTIATLLPSYGIEINAASCNPADTGSFVEHLVSKKGCDSVVTTSITLLPSKEEFIYKSTCNANEEGKTIERFSGANGCDSTVTIITTLLSSSEVTINTTTCNASEAGIEVEVLTNASGCDSTVTTITTLLLSSEVTINATTCDVGKAGIEVEVLTNASGCDSTVTTITTLLLSSEVTINATTCDASEAGIEVEVLTNASGCDSTVTTITTLLLSSEVTVNATTCDASEAGIEVEVLTNASGCDSIVTKIFTLFPSSETIVNQTTCDPIKEGVDFELNTSLNGCDSIVMIITNLLPSYEMTFYKTTCDSSQVGIKVNVYSTVLGCDSIVTTNTTLLPSYNITINKVATSLLDTGRVSNNLISIKGCDSIVTIISSYLENERPYANVNYWTNFDSNIDRYWSLHSDGVSIVETRTRTRGSNKGKINLVFSTTNSESARTKAQFSIGHADLHIDLKSILPFLDIKMDYEWNNFDKWNSNSSDDTSGIYYVDQTNGLVRFVAEYERNNQEGNGSINLSDWARSNNIILSDRAILRFLYQTDAVFTPNNFNSGGLHIESVHVHQNIEQTNSTEYQQVDNFENIFNYESQARMNNPNSMDESLLSESNFDVLVYPNPVKLGERINIELPLEIGKEVSVELIDLLGRRLEHVLVGTSDLFGQTISINTDKANVTGTYFVKIVSENQEVIKKIQIVRN